MKLEHRQQPLLPRTKFILRLGRSVGLAALLLLASLAMGTAGYHSLAGLGWVDAFLNASMILTGMGPVSPLPTDAAKLFASVYALWSGVIFLAGTGVVIAPVFHRFMHRFHLEDENDRES